MTAEPIDPVQKVLREAFPKEQVGNLPRITCNDCRSSRGKVCDRHTKSQCNICRQWITNSHIHLSYVGHAAVTDRLLKADPNWTWEPAYRDVDPVVLAAACASADADIVAQVIANSPPLTDGPFGMWVKLTVGGVTRLGYGTDDDTGSDHNKKLIGDGLRNAGMRFGIALDLWSKEDLGSDEPPTATAAPTQAVPMTSGRRDWIAEGRACTDLAVLLKIGKDCTAAGEFDGPVKKALLARHAELKAAQRPVDQDELTFTRR